MQYAIKREAASSYAKRWEHLAALHGYESPQPKHAVSEGLLTLAEDKRPEATLLIGLS
jgi:hypothetical protein